MGTNVLDSFLSRGPRLVDVHSGQALEGPGLVEAVKSRMTKMGISEGQLLLVGVSNSVDSVIQLLSALCAGASVILVDPKLPRQTLSGWAEAFDVDQAIDVPVIPKSGPPSPDPIQPVPRQQVLLATSGSTGNPKFVRISVDALIANAQQIVSALEITPISRALSHLPLFYSFGLSVVTSHLLAGATLVMTSYGVLQKDFWSSLIEHRVTSLSGVPYTFELMRRLGFDEMELGSLSDLCQAGGRLADQDVLHFHKNMYERGGRFWVMYGQTEASARISVLHPRDLPDRLGSVGRALEGSSFEVLDSDPDGSGELIVKGPQVMLGYAESRADLHSPDQLEGVLRTGDLAVVDDGYLYLRGRLKRIAKLFGTRMNLDDLEKQLSKYAKVVVLESDNKIVVVEEGSTSLNSRVIERELQLPPRSVEVHHWEEAPRLANGKVDFMKLGSELSNDKGLR